MGQSPPANPGTQVNPVVKIYTLGRFGIEIEGRPLALGARGQRKPLELLKVLVALDGQDVPEYQLSDSLWPDSEGDQASRNFRTNLHRLRKLIGHEALRLEQRQLTLNQRVCWVDTSAFQVFQARAAQAMEAGDLSAAWRHTESALNLYKKPFLEGEFEPPEILSARERFHGIFLRHIDDMGRMLLQAREFEKAEILFLKGLEADDLAEPFYQHLMDCYLRQGKLAMGLSVYQRCLRTFRARTGADPSPETKAIYQLILADQNQSHSQRVSIPEKTADSLPVPEMGSLSEVPSKGEGERRRATVILFSITGYAALGGELVPEEAERITARFRAEIGRAVTDHGGVINQIFRDEIIALFGVSSAHEDDPVRAVRCALAVKEILRRFIPEMEPWQGAPPRIATAIATGLIVTHMGGAIEGQYGIAGEPVEMCALLLKNAGTDEILVDAETNRMITPFFATEVFKPGKVKTGQIFRIAGENPIQTLFDAAKHRGLTPFIGQEQELEILKGCLEKTLAGEGQIVMVTGEAGLGKSRLTYEFCQNLLPPGVAVIKGRCGTYGTETSFLPFKEAARRILQIQGSGESVEKSETVLKNIRTTYPALEPYVPAYLHLFSISSEDHPLPNHLREKELRRWLQEAIAALLIQYSKRGPVVLLLEDWHWADEASEETLRYLMGAIPPYAIMLIVTCRPDYVPSWRAPGHLTPINLAPLEENLGIRMVLALLGAEGLPAGLGTLIHTRTGGNPFFIEEVCNDLLEQGAVGVSNGAVANILPLEEFILPPTVQAVIRSRLDWLEKDQLDILKAASIIGRYFTRGLLEDILPASRSLDQGIDELIAQDLIQQTQIIPELEYRFKHVLTQVVVYDSLLLPQRRTLHGKVAGAIESIHAGRLKEHIEVLAHHYLNSENREKACYFLEQAGEKAAGYFSLMAARNFFNDAIALLDQPGIPEWGKKKHIDLTLKLGGVSFYAASSELFQSLEKARVLCEELNDMGRLAKVRFCAGQMYYVWARFAEALKDFAGCLKLSNDLNDQELQNRSRMYIGRCSFFTAEFALGCRYLKESMKAMERMGNRTEAAYGGLMLATIFAWEGEFQKSSRTFETVLDTARTADDPSLKSAALSQRSAAGVLRGDWEQSLSDATVSAELAGRIGNTYIEGYATITRGIVLFFTGDRENGKEMMRKGLQKSTLGEGHGMPVLLAWYAETMAMGGSIDEARDMIEYAEKSARKTGQKVGLPALQRARALVAAKQTPQQWNSVKEHLDKALSFAEKSGARPDMAISLYLYSDLSMKIGDHGLARQKLGHAIAMFREMAMNWWLEQAKKLAGSIP